MSRTTKIEFSKQQYETLIRAIETGDSIYGIMSDMVDQKYKKQAKEIDSLIDHILSHASEVGMSHIVEEFDGLKHVSDELSETYLDDILAYEDCATWDNLIENLVNRDFYRLYSQDQIEKMTDREVIEKQSLLEDFYRREFEKHGLNRIEINGSRQ